MDETSNHRNSERDTGVPGTEGGDLGDRDLTTKDRAYSPASERETEVKQREAGDANLPGTGGPDDSGDDLEVPGDDDLDLSKVAERSDPGHRPGDG